MKTLFLLLIFTITSSVQSQIDTLTKLHSTKQQIGFNDFVTQDNQLFALNDSGYIAVFNLGKLEFSGNIYPPKKDKFLSLQKSKRNELFITTLRGRVYKFDPLNFKLKSILDIKYGINSLCVNSKNKLFLINHNGIYDPIAKRTWDNFQEYHSQLIYKRDSSGINVPTEKYFIVPDYVFLDMNDICWMIKNQGEWGKELYLFDTRNSEIYTNYINNFDLNSVHIKSLFNDTQGNTVIFNASWEQWKDTLHFIKISQKNLVIHYSCVFQEENQYDPSTTVKLIDGIINVIANHPRLVENIGINTATFNKGDSCIYVSTSEGFYKTKFSDENTTLALVLVKNISLNEIKMEFANNEQLIFLTREGYLGLFQNNKYLLFR
jgi:hypothetical protein